MFPLLNNGITRAIFILSGNIPFSREILNIFFKGTTIYGIKFLIRHKSSSSRPYDFLGFTLATNCKMSTSVTGFKNNAFLTLVDADRYCEN